MILISIALLISGILIGAGIALALTRRTALRAEKAAWSAANIYYTRRNPQP